MKSIRYVALLVSVCLLACSCDSNDPPSISDQKFTIWEDTHYRYWDPILIANDPDGDRNLTFRIIEGNEQGIFALKTSGRILVLKPEMIDYDLFTDHFMKVAVSDNHEKNPLESTAVIHIQVLDRNEITDKMVAYYPFNVDATDQSVYQQHGTVFGAQLTDGRNEESELAYLFDGLDDYIRIPDHDLLSYPKGNFSISIWAKAVSHKDSSLILCKGNGELDREYALGITSDSLIYFRVHDRGNRDRAYEVYTNTKVNYSDWYHVVAAWDGYMMHIYLNGELENSQFCDLTPANYESDLFIGAADDSISEFTFHGALDDLHLYRRMLLSYEVRNLFRSATNPWGWWG